jgi:uncharacterized protein YdeI (BOF family)
MKKLLILVSIMVISSTAMASQRQGKTSDETQVDATYVTPLTLSLTIATIDFGDVYTGSTATDESVTANVEGEPNETFTYTISSDGDFVTLDGSGNATLEENSVALPEGTAAFDFDVGLDTANILANFDTETVTVRLVYDSIEGTSSD